MKLVTTPTYLPRGLEWRWTRLVGAAGLLVTLAAAIASQRTESSPVGPISLAALALLVFGLGFRGRAQHLQGVIVAQLAREQEGKRLALVGLSTAGLAHELKNSLTVLQGFTELARKAASEDGATDRVKSHLAEIESQTSRLTADLGAFLALASEGPQAATQSVAEAVAQTRKLLAPLAQLRELQLDVEIADEVKRTVDDPGFRRALLNLGLNALHHAKKQVRVIARVEGAETVVAVEDDGPGVPAKQEPLLFTPFSPGRPGGIGLGLAQVREALEREHGTVHHEAVTPSGARFVLRLPSPVPHTDSATLAG